MNIGNENAASTNGACPRPELLVVGSISSDRIVTPSGRAGNTLGGAGLYAALGATLAGVPTAVVGLVSDDIPHEVIAVLPFDTAGLVRSPGRLLRFDIVYDVDGNARYDLDDARAEELITPQMVLAKGGKAVRAAHLCPTGSPRCQAEVAHAMRAEGAWLSATTFSGRILAEPREIARLVGLVDVMVCSVEDARLLSPLHEVADSIRLLRSVAPEAHKRPYVVVVTDGGNGATVQVPGTIIKVSAAKAELADPTGAGESFAGAFAAALLAGTPLQAQAEGEQAFAVSGAGTVAARIAAIAVSGLGPEALLQALGNQAAFPAAELKRAIRR